MQCVVVDHSNGELLPERSRKNFLESLEPSFLQWIVSKHAKEKNYCFYCRTKCAVINIHERYRNNVKNIGKRNFDACGETNARESFIKWAFDNEIDLFICKHYAALKGHYSSYKYGLYLRYKKNMPKINNKRHKRNDGSRFRAVPENCDGC